MIAIGMASKYAFVAQTRTVILVIMRRRYRCLQEQEKLLNRHPHGYVFPSGSIASRFQWLISAKHPRQEDP
jgi:hypothetical protein